jgi:hypothetical protein
MPTISPGVAQELTQLKKRIIQLESGRATIAPQPTFKSPSLWLTNMLQGVTLAAIVGCAFWLGALSSTISSASMKVDKLADSVAGASKESLSRRISVIETKLDSLDKRLDSK